MNSVLNTASICNPVSMNSPFSIKNLIMMPSYLPSVKPASKESKKAGPTTFTGQESASGIPVSLIKPYFVYRNYIIYPNGRLLNCQSFISHCQQAVILYIHFRKKKLFSQTIVIMSIPAIAARQTGIGLIRLIIFLVCYARSAHEAAGERVRRSYRDRQSPC